MHLQLPTRPILRSRFSVASIFTLVFFAFALLAGLPAQTTCAQGVGAKAPRLVYKVESEDELLIALAATNEVAVWDTQNDELKEVIPLADDNGNTCVEPRSVVYSDPGVLWAACFASQEVWALDTTTENNEVIGKVKDLEGVWEMDLSSNENHTWIVVSAWGGGVGPWSPSESGDESGLVALIEADPSSEDFGTLVPESELPGSEAPNPLKIPSSEDGGPWGTAACEDIFWISNDGSDVTYKLTLDPFSLEIFDKGELPWEVDCRGDLSGLLAEVVIANGGDDDPPEGGTESKTIDGPILNRDGEPVGTSFAQFPRTDNPNACWDEIFSSWSDHQKEKYNNHTDLPWVFEDNPAVGAADLTRARSGDASFTIVKIFDDGRCQVERVPIGEDRPPEDKEPWGADIGPDDTVYLVDMHLNKTIAVDLANDTRTDFNNQTYEAPRDAAVMNGKLYVASSGTHEISSQDDGEPNDFDYSNTENLGGLEVFDRETGNPLLQHPLPIELSRLEATIEREGTVRLAWQTASETNNAGFEVLRTVKPSKTGASPSEGSSGNDFWTEIGFVESKAPGGTTDASQSYRFVDEEVPFAADRVAYRLRQVDHDGATTLTDPVELDRPVNRLRLRKVFPNPVRRRVTVQFAVPEEEVTLQVYDLMGRAVRTLAERQVDGRQEKTFDLSNLASGTYFLRLKGSGQSRIRQFSVVR